MTSIALVVSADLALVAALRRALAPASWSLAHAPDGRKVPARCELDAPELVLIDLQSLGSGGVDLCQQIRERVALPILALGALEQRPLLMAALDAGADDCLTVPFGPDELLVRVQAVLRRSQPPSRTAQRIRCGRLEIEPQAVQVWRDGQEVPLRAKERALLGVFLAHPGQVLTHQFLLQRVWGVHYGAETNYLHTQINGLRRKLEDDPARPSYLLTERGSGYRLVLPPAPPAPAPDPAPTRAAGWLEPPAPARPPDAGDLVGRDDALATLRARLRRDHLVVITGMTGVGKTALAAALARSAAAEPGQIFWHALHAGQGLDALIWSLAGFLARQGQDEVWQLVQHAHRHGTALPPGEVMLSYLFQVLAGQPYLLCFDDLQVADDDPALAACFARLLALATDGAAQLILVSQRLPAWLAPHQATPLPGLAAPASTLLLQQQGLALAEPLLAALHAQTEGNPQLLLLAGALLRDTPDPATLIAQLPQASLIEHFLLTRIDRGLTERERHLMATVALLSGAPATLDAIEAVSAQRQVWPALRGLCARSLLLEGAGVERAYGQHALVRAFYRQQLSRREQQHIHRRAAQYYLQEQPDRLHATRHLVAAGDLAAAVLGVTDHVRASINQGQAHALAQTLAQLAPDTLDPDVALALALAQAELAAWLGDSRAARAHYDAALACLARLPHAPLVSRRAARAYHGLGELLEHDDPRAALVWLQRGLDELDGRATQDAAALYVRLSTVYITLGDYAAARAAVEQALGYLPPNPGPLRIRALISLGVVACAEGDPALGNRLTLQALELSRQTHDHWTEIQIWLNLGVEIEIAGDWDAAEAHYQQALQLATRLGSTKYQMALAGNLGILHTNRGDFAAAEQSLLRALALAERAQVTAWAVASQASLADLYVRMGDLAAATQVLAAVEPQAEAVGAVEQLPEIARTWALAHLAAGRTAAAEAAALRAVALALEQGQPIGHGIGLRVLGQVRAAQGQPAAAADAFAQSLALLAPRDPYEAARTQLHWGRLPGAASDPAAAAHLAAARQTFAQLGARHDLALLEAQLSAGDGAADQGAPQI